ncbi:hypothetical protein BLA60_02605 [Actinophytocola xinjiangensis]|uniref:Uncharacterized protein n=1 Tax=Actinophytocola xinjiangensis TaxID=485602 RepID=A0A7Z0WTC6_9PSEU|nr:hypothetical protein [Actinophytocola xinjiangensis]OLF14074.1 hypothetical protein BLA60_02605 [Actinophytocola xinjiangensis]
MEVRQVSLSDGVAGLRAAGRDPAVGAVLVDATGAREIDPAFPRRLESLDTPTVAVVSGDCDAGALAVLAAATLGVVTDDVTVTVEHPTVLGLGLTWSLPAALGAVPARRLLFAATLDAWALRASGLAHDGDPAAEAARLAVPGAALLVRSLRVAARSTPAQALAYDDELRRLG